MEEDKDEEIDRLRDLLSYATRHKQHAGMAVFELGLVEQGDGKAPNWRVIVCAPLLDEEALAKVAMSELLAWLDEEVDRNRARTVEAIEEARSHLAASKPVPTHMPGPGNEVINHWISEWQRERNLLAAIVAAADAR